MRKECQGTGISTITVVRRLIRALSQQRCHPAKHGEHNVVPVRHILFTSKATNTKFAKMAYTLLPKDGTEPGDLGNIAWSHVPGKHIAMVRIVFIGSSGTTICYHHLS